MNTLFDFLSEPTSFALAPLPPPRYQPQSTTSKPGYYGATHLESPGVWTNFNYDTIVAEFGEVLNTPAPSAANVSPSRTLARMISEASLAEQFKALVPSNINRALDAVLLPPTRSCLPRIVRGFDARTLKPALRDIPQILVLQMLNDMLQPRLRVPVHDNITQAQLLDALLPKLWDIIDSMPTHHKDALKAMRGTSEDRIILLELCSIKISKTEALYTLVRDRLPQGSPGQLAAIAQVGMGTKLSHVIPWVCDHALQIRKDGRRRTRDLWGLIHDEERFFHTLNKYLPPSLQAVCVGKPRATWLDLVFQALPAPITRTPDGDTYQLITLVHGSQAESVNSLRPDLAGVRYPRPGAAAAERNCVPGDLKFSWNWDPEWNENKTTFKKCLSQVYCYANQHRTRYGYVLSDLGLRCFRRVSYIDHHGREILRNGHIELSPPILSDAFGPRVLTVKLALWYIHMLAAKGNDYELGSTLWVNGRFRGIPDGPVKLID